MTAALIGQRFGRLLALEETRLGRGQHLAYVCICDCGSVKPFYRSNLMRGFSKSCGCWNLEKMTERGHLINTKHGMWKTRTYQAWASMKRRCQTPSTGNYDRYGAAGITVCARWQTFEAFFSDMGECPEGMTLDRYPNQKGNYEPGNCRWATWLEQSANRRTTLFLTDRGLTLPLTEWARRKGVPDSLLRKRQAAGWADARVLNEPINNQFERIRAQKPLVSNQLAADSVAAKGKQ